MYVEYDVEYDIGSVRCRSVVLEKGGKHGIIL